MIGKASATVNLGALSATYDGSAKSATAGTTPSGLTVNLTYDSMGGYAQETGAGPAQESIVHLSMRWFWRYELEHLLHRAGFTDVTIHGNFDRSPVGRTSPAFVVLAR